MAIREGKLEPVFRARYVPLRGHSPSDSFWDHVYLRGRRGELGVPPEQHSTLNNQVIERLGGAITHRLKRALAAAGSRTSGEGFELGVIELTDGSLMALIGVDNFEGFISALSGISPSLVLSLIDSCSTEALRDVTGIGGYQCEILPDATLSAALGRKELAGPPPQTTNPSWGNVLVAAQRTFWLVPLLLALIVFWVAFTGYMSQLKQVSEREEKFAREQTAGAEATATRIKQLEALVLDLVGQLRKEREQPPAKPCECQAACCPVAQCAGDPPKRAMPKPPVCRH